MFQITRDPSSRGSIQCLINITVVVLSCPLTWTQSVLWQRICPWRLCVLYSLERHSLSKLCSTHTHHGQICCHNTDYVLINGHDRTITVILAKHCIELPDDGSLVI